jgi:hypothetical protein
MRVVSGWDICSRSRLLGEVPDGGGDMVWASLVSKLEHTVNWHFSVDGLQAASDRVLQLTGRLELPNLSRRSLDRLHTSSDGRKFEVCADSLNETPPI